MNIYVIFAQRKEFYDGEYGVEALEVADEFTMDANPDWLYEKLEGYKQKSEFVAAEIVEIDLGDSAQDDIRERLMGRIRIEGKVQ